MLDQLVFQGEKKREESDNMMSCTLAVVSSRLGTSIGRLGMSIRCILIIICVFKSILHTVTFLRLGCTEIICL